MATGSISSAGIGSGLDVSSIVAQLVAVESRPLTLLQSQADSMNSRLSTFGKLQSYFSTMQDKANALTTTTLWGGTTASLSNSSDLGRPPSRLPAPAASSTAPICSGAD